jgi:hypothetical protein
VTATATVRQAELGPVITGADVEHAILDTLFKWLPSYLRECERLRHMPVGDLPTPRGWLITGRQLEKFTSDQLPCVIVMAGGIVVRPVVSGYPGNMTCVWVVDVGTIWNTAWGRMTRDHAQLMVRAISLVLIQRPLEGGLAGVVDMTGERYDEIDFGDTRTYSAAVAQFTVEVEDVMWRAGGPPPYVEPGDPMDTWGPWTQVTETGVTVEAVPITQTEAEDE